MKEGISASSNKCLAHTNFPPDFVFVCHVGAWLECPCPMLLLALPDAQRAIPLLFCFFLCQMSHPILEHFPEYFSRSSFAYVLCSASIPRSTRCSRRLFTHRSALISASWRRNKSCFSTVRLCQNCHLPFDLVSEKNPRFFPSHSFVARHGIGHIVGRHPPACLFPVHCVPCTQLATKAEQAGRTAGGDRRADAMMTNRREMRDF